MSPLRFQIARLGFVLLICGPMAVSMAAPIQPFDAVVRAKPGEDVYARSGPAILRQYPTQKLAPGDKVRVLRKDFGGWYMIEPPPGSFSWILAAHVERTGPQQGTVKQKGVIVRVGSANSTQRDIEQVRLNTGDRVEIIGEQVLEEPGKGPQNWFKIKPPRGEYRWVKGSFLVELNPDGTPKVIAAHSASKVAQEPDDAGNSPAVAVSPTKPRTNSQTPAIQRDPESLAAGAPRYGHPPGRSQSADPFEEQEGSGTEQTEESAIREDLVLLDEELRQILDKPPVAWDLSTQLEDLRTLQEMSVNMPVASEVDRRLKRVLGLQQIHEDARAIALHNTRALPNSTGMSAARQATIQSPAQPPRSSNGTSLPSGTGTSSTSRPPGSRFEGAGIIYRVTNGTPGIPRHVIAAPDGRILCYLDADPAVDLNRYVGQAVGLNGRRYYEPRLQADRMLVQKVTPVRLAQP